MYMCSIKKKTEKRLFYKTVPNNENVFEAEFFVTSITIN